MGGGRLREVVALRELTVICFQIPHLLRTYPVSTVISVLLSTGLVPPSQPITI